MKMVSMVHKMEKEAGPEACCCDDMKYPYGTQINLESEQMKALGMKEMPKVGMTMMIHAKVKVVSCRSEEGKEGEEMASMSMQITDMGIEEGKMSDKEIAGKLYGGES